MAKTITISQKTCKKCGHEWLPRSTDEPVICPKCKSARWKLGPKAPKVEKREEVAA
jgi:predicted Zn-ribbon and HTH transcriptional regulator